MDLRNLSKNDTIIACATAPGMGAIAVIRISGPESIKIVNKNFKSFVSGKSLLKAKSHTANYGELFDSASKESIAIDEVLATLFRHGKSFTGEETVEISCHGSTYIVKAILNLFLNQGVRIADPGEFTMRAYRNGKFDLAQAEAVADLIHSSNAAGANIALNQMRGGFSNKIEDVREELIKFASLMELELDFGEEDVEFADRTQFIALINKILDLVAQLIQSFELGNVIKNGVPVAIVGEPNVGKSTLLNTLLNDDRAIVSDIPGTTRDVIEDNINIQGIDFRFIDTAGIRETTDYVEGKGIEKTFQKIETAKVVLHLLDANQSQTINGKFIEDLYNSQYAKFNTAKKIIFVLNKCDLAPTNINSDSKSFQIISISAKNNTGVNDLIDNLTSSFKIGEISPDDIIITNARHVQALTETQESLNRILEAMKTGIPGDLLAIDIRAALYSLGTITGHVTTDDLLGFIFSKFCIGK
jgi:tRNA modification GTPase